MKELLVWLVLFSIDFFLSFISFAFVAHPILLLFLIRIIGQRFYEVMKFAWFLSRSVLEEKRPEGLNAKQVIRIWIVKVIADVCISASLVHFLEYHPFAFVLALRLIGKRIYEALITHHISGTGGMSISLSLLVIRSFFVLYS